MTVFDSFVHVIVIQLFDDEYQPQIEVVQRPCVLGVIEYEQVIGGPMRR
jgi:hypothetical protein